MFIFEAFDPGPMDAIIVILIADIRQYKATFTEKYISKGIPIALTAKGTILLIMAPVRIPQVPPIIPMVRASIKSILTLCFLLMPTEVKIARECFLSIKLIIKLFSTPNIPITTANIEKLLNIEISLLKSSEFNFLNSLILLI